MAKHMSRRQLLRTSLGGTAIALASTVSGVRPAFAQSTLDAARQAGLIRVGFANEPPFGYADAGGRLTGEAPEVLRAVLARVGVPEVEGVLTEFGSLIPALQAGRFDIVAAGMAVRPDRCEQILFSQPTYSVSIQLAVTPGNPLGIATYDEVAANPEARIGILTGSISVQQALDAGVQEGQIVTLPDMPGLVAALNAERVDVIVGTSLTWTDLLAKMGGAAGLEALPPFTEVAGQSVVSHGAFGFRQEDAALRDAVDAELAGFIGSDEHLALVQPFGFSSYTLPVQSTEELCQGLT